MSEVTADSAARDAPEEASSKAARLISITFVFIIYAVERAASGDQFSFRGGLGFSGSTLPACQPAPRQFQTENLRTACLVTTTAQHLYHMSLNGLGGSAKLVAGVSILDYGWLIAKLRPCHFLTARGARCRLPRSASVWQLATTMFTSESEVLPPPAASSQGWYFQMQLLIGLPQKEVR